MRDLDLGSKLVHFCEAWHEKPQNQHLRNSGLFWLLKTNEKRVDLWLIRFKKIRKKNQKDS